MSVAPPTARRPPGPRGKPVLGSILDFRSDILRALIDGWHEYGDIVEFNVAGASYLVVHPDYIEHILRDNESNYPHAPFLDARWAKIVGNGLVTSKGDFWARQRRLADPSFHQDRIAGFGQIMTETTEEMLEGWKPRVERGDPIDVREEMMRLTITILSKAMFSADIWDKTDTISRTVSVLLTHASNRLFSPVDFPEQIPLPSHRRYIAARDEFDELIYGIIAERRREPREDVVPALDVPGRGATLARGARGSPRRALGDGRRPAAADLHLARDPGVAAHVSADLDVPADRDRGRRDRRLPDQGGQEHLPQPVHHPAPPGFLGQPGGFRPGPLRAGEDPGLAPVQVLAVRRRPAEVHRQQLRGRGDAARRRDRGATLRPRARPGTPGGDPARIVVASARRRARQRQAGRVREPREAGSLGRDRGEYDRMRPE